MLTRSERSAFTLAELVVATAIVVLLAGLLFPLVGAAMHMGTCTRCAGNLMQLGQLCRRYADLHNGYYPAEGNKGETDPASSPAWWYRLADFLPEMDVRSDASVFQCPGHSEEPPRIFDAASPKSYKMNAYLDFRQSVPRYRRGRWAGEGRYVFFADAVAGETGMGQWGHLFPSGVTAAYHPDAANVLFLDLHVEAVGEPAPDTDGEPDWKTALEWTPHWRD